MMENSDSYSNKNLDVDANSLSEQELILIFMFRMIKLERQKDLLRILEAFSNLSD